MTSFYQTKVAEFVCGGTISHHLAYYVTHLFYDVVHAELYSVQTDDDCKQIPQLTKSAFPFLILSYQNIQSNVHCAFCDVTEWRTSIVSYSYDPVTCTCKTVETRALNSFAGKRSKSDYGLNPF